MLSYNWDIGPPTSAQLSQAEKFFNIHKPQLLFSAAKLLTMPFTAVPEVAFLGRSNVGKSSLLNALLGSPICHTSSRPGRTRTMNAFSVGGPPTTPKDRKSKTNNSNNNNNNNSKERGHGRGRLNVLDMPGYGKGSRAEWGVEITKYLSSRRELKRAFVLVDAHHGLKASDGEMLAMLRHAGVPHQVVLSKVDRALLPRRAGRALRQAELERRADQLRRVFEALRAEVQPGKRKPGAFGQIIACAAENLGGRGCRARRVGRWGLMQ